MQFRIRSFPAVALTLIGVGLAASACEDGARRATPVGPQFAGGPSTVCDFKDAVKLARAYFPGKGKGSIQDLVLDKLKEMEDDCDAGAATAYTQKWYEVAAIIEGVLEDDTAGDPTDGDAFIKELLTIASASGPIFNPCGVAPASVCSPWDGFPTLPSFVPALSSGAPNYGTWAVVDLGSSTAVCSGHRSPCAGIDPALEGDVWGVEPSLTWGAALHSRRTVVFGSALDNASPTGEDLFPGATIDAYEFELIPHPDEFKPDVVPPAVLEVGLCSIGDASSNREGLVQKGAGTILTETTLGFCLNETALTPGGSLLARAGRLVMGFLDPTPRPLWAAVSRASPGGSTGAFSPFYAVEVPVPATYTFEDAPADAIARQPIPGEIGPAPVVKAITTSVYSPIEDVLTTITVEKNNGQGPDPDFVLTSDNPEIICTVNVCTGRTQADEDPLPGFLVLSGLKANKTGAYRLCVTGQQAPLEFDKVCAGPFNIRPH
jgi:hypothetical protein